MRAGGSEKSVGHDNLANSFDTPSQTPAETGAASIAPAQKAFSVKFKKVKVGRDSGDRSGRG